jgi:acetolactate decarboxylase
MVMRLKSSGALVLIVVAVTMVAWRAADVPAAREEGVVRWVGAMHKAVHDADHGGKVSLEALAKQPHLNAIGPVEGLRGEITVIDGERWVAVMSPDGPAGSADVQAAFLAWSYVPAWTSVAIPEGVQTKRDVEAFILRAAREAGFPEGEPLVFRIDGRVREMDLHIIWHLPGDAPGRESHERAKKPVRVKGEAVRVVGFWSERHRGVFTPMVTPFHMHAVAGEGRVSGHVDDLLLEAGATLRLPHRAPASAPSAAGS